jgi:hypothetical protein
MAPRAARLTLGVCVLLAATSCVRREGRNTECQWPPEVLAPLDLSQTGQLRHLAADAQFAEELGIRHGDAFRGKESVDERGRRTQECTSRLVNYLAMLHSVSVEDVERARARRETRVDVVAVFAPMAVVFGTIAFFVAGKVQERFPSGPPFIVTTLLLSAVVAAAGVLAGELWSWLVEIARVGNGHLSYRALRLPWTRHRTEILLAGVAIFLLTSWYRSRREGR